jgi:hypothetical protein
MAFTRIDLIPHYDFEETKHLQSRWTDDPEGPRTYEYVLRKIRQGGGEDFLQWDFENGRLGLLRDYCDLAGMKLQGEDIIFPEGDNFENIDFSSAELWHCKFTAASFPSTHFDFARFYNVNFSGCTFALAWFYCCRFEKCTFEHCDFIDGNGFNNSKFISCTFLDCFFAENMFTDCQFDENVAVRNHKGPLLFGLRQKANQFKEELKAERVSGIYRGIKESFEAGEVFPRYRKYFLIQRQAYTRFNEKFKLRCYLWEFISGYGVRPFRVLIALLIIFALSTAWFTTRIGFEDGLLLSSGALLTFGAKAEVLNNLSVLDRGIYIGSAFLGVSLVALFITVLGSVLLRES